MEIRKKLGAIEAILFASGEPVEIYRLSQAANVDVGSLPSMIRLLNERYDDQESGICIKKLDSSYQMCTREIYAPQIREVFETRNVRGVDSSSVVNNLVEKGLIEEAGRLDVPGKPLVYRTTAVFLRSFGLSSIAELPSLSSYKQDEQLEFDDLS